MIQKENIKIKNYNAYMKFIRVHSEGTTESAKRTYGGLLISRLHRDDLLQAIQTMKKCYFRVHFGISGNY